MVGVTVKFMVLAGTGFAAILAAAGFALPSRLDGHFPYALAPETVLQAVDEEQTVRLHYAAASAFARMRAAAAIDGAILLPVSGHRTLEHQHRKYLLEAQHAGPGAAGRRALRVAPPGYSEHHTGYAIDLDDGSHGGRRRVEPRFSDTRAYAWLKRNAERFGFEESFPMGNSQGAAEEPWHWRWVGDRESRRLFKLARICMTEPWLCRW